MNPQNIPNTTPEVTPVQEQNVQTGVESTPIAELVQASPVQPVIPSEEKDPEILCDTQNDNVTVAAEITPTEISDLTDVDVPKADDDWIGQVREVIKNDTGQPYKEEKDAELLNEAYMKQRFNVDIDAPVEEK